ncbi:hypothetical protein JCM14469_09400 [Desulfatiferula olefinivorans]
MSLSLLLDGRLRPLARPVLIVLSTLAINLVLFALIPFLAETEKSIRDPGDPATVVTMEKPRLIDEPEQARKQAKPDDEEIRRLPDEAALSDRDQPPPPMPDLDLDTPDFDVAGGKGPGMAVVAPPRMAGLDSVFHLNELDKKPRLVSQIEPVYPHDARRKGIEGKVVVQFVVTRNGQVTDIRVVDATPPGIFDQKAVDAVGKWRFEPGTYRGNPVDSRVTLPIRFEL